MVLYPSVNLCTNFAQGNEHRQTSLLLLDIRTRVHFKSLLLHEKRARQGVLRKEVALRQLLPAQKGMKKAWPLRSRLFCLLDFVGQNPMLVIPADNKRPVRQRIFVNSRRSERNTTLPLFYEILQIQTFFDSVY